MYFCRHISRNRHICFFARKDLAQAKDAKKDEFYTQLDNIANELKYCKPYFCDKVVLCNCDDPYKSNFFKYFALNFNSLGLKKLIATCYNGFCCYQLFYSPNRFPFVGSLRSLRKSCHRACFCLNTINYSQM